MDNTAGIEVQLKYNMGFDFCKFGHPAARGAKAGREGSDKSGNCRIDNHFPARRWQP
jgi:hypothetical protein